MPHVGVERLGAGHAQKDAAEQREGGEAAVPEVMEPIGRTQSGQHRRVFGDAADAEDGDDRKPRRHDWAEQLADAGRAERLQKKQQPQDDDGGRQHVRAEGRHRQVQPFEGREDRDRRRDRAVAIDQRGAEQPRRDDDRPRLPLSCRSTT